MNRDLVFFVAGLSFGAAAGYFTFRAVQSDGAPGSAPAQVASGAASRADASPIGLEGEPSFAPLDEELESQLEADAKARPDDANVRAQLGGLYIEAGLFAEAIPWLERAIELAPGELHVRNHLAICYLNQGRLDDAIRAYEKTLEISPENPASLLGLGRIKLYVQKDFGGGLAMWERLMEVAPDSPEARSVRDELEALKSAHSGG